MRLKGSLTVHLLAWTLGALFLAWAVFMAFGWRTGEHEADELTDGHLASVTALLLSHAPGEFLAPLRMEQPRGTLELRAHDYQQSLSVVVWNAQGQLLTRAGGAPLPRFAQREEGFATLDIGQPSQRWRVFSRWSPDGARKVMVMLLMQERDDLARDIARQIVAPGLWLLPALAVALGFAIRRGLRPLYAVARQVHRLDIQHATPLPLPRQAELAATVDAVNRLVRRYHAALTREREVASEFAHELRTPLAALALQARELQELPEGAQRREAARQFEAQALRAGEVVSHLLALARAARADLDEAAQPVDLCELARAVVAEHAPQAHAGGRELAFVGSNSMQVMGHLALLHIAIRNLVENSLSHTPAGTSVEVQVDAGRRWLQVCDQWPADASPCGDGPAARLGLGHRVVGKVAEIHGARFERIGERCHRLTFGPVSTGPAVP